MASWTKVENAESLLRAGAGEWVRLNRTTVERRDDVVPAINAFEPPDFPAGHEAARWLREEALENEGSTRTRLLLHRGRLEGFIALAAGQVRITPSELGYPGNREAQPAVLLTWIAKHRDADVSGLQLMVVAYGIARRVAREIGAVAFALDAHDDALVAMWKAPPYEFEETNQRRRLWTPIEIED